MPSQALAILDEPDREKREAAMTELFARADQGDPEALTVTRELFDQVPALWQAAGDSAASARRAIVTRVAGQSPIVIEATERELAALQRELAGPDPSPLERLLAERITLCRLMLFDYEARYAKGLHELTFEQATFHQRRIDQAHRRYLSAIESLARVRRLLGPTVQLNMAQKIDQINVLGGAPE